MVEAAAGAAQARVAAVEAECRRLVKARQVCD